MIFEVKSVSETVFMRVPKEMVERLREIFPELEGESDAAVVRIALQRAYSFTRVDKLASKEVEEE